MSVVRNIRIDGVEVNDGTDCYIIAEIGNNHQGDIELCKKMFNTAKDCGATAVKLQKRDNKELFCKALYNSPYNSEHTFGKTYGQHRDFLELDRDQYKELIDHAKQIGITLFATAFDFPSADFLADLDMPAFKLASGDLTNTPLLKHIAGFNKPMIISTGGADMADIRRAYAAVSPINKQIVLLQCTAGYPPAWEELNLNVIRTLRDEFPDVVVGLSSHDSGIAMSLVAYCLGARMIEKHFTLNRAMQGTDHAFSLEHSGLRKLVRDLQRARISMGDGIKRSYASEEKPLYKMGKKLVAAHAISKGSALRLEDIAIRSPNDGLPPYEIDNVIGKTLNRDLAEDENISFNDLV